MTSERTWQSTEVIAAPEAREAIEYGLMEAGALGTETIDTENPLRIKAYYGQPVPDAQIQVALFDALRIYGLSANSLIHIETRAVPDRDWLSEWKKHWQPIEIGERFIIAPSWNEIKNSSDRFIIRIDPGMAFGTGTHETTRLCLKAIEKHFRGGSFLDLGTGTGILAIAAAKLFPEGEISAYDTDPSAIAIARENARLNEVTHRVAFYVGTINEQTASADLVCANLTANVILELLPTLLLITCGRLVLGGILDSQLGAVSSRLEELGVRVIEVESDGEWIAMVV